MRLKDQKEKKVLESSPGRNLHGARSELCWKNTGWRVVNTGVAGKDRGQR